MNAERPAARTLGALLREKASLSPQHSAVIYQGLTVSYTDLERESIRLAKALVRLGVRRGDRVAALMGNRPEWLIAYFAVAHVGAVFVPINTWYQRREIAWTLRHCGVSVLLSAATFLRHDFRSDLAAILKTAHLGGGIVRSPDLPFLRGVAFLDSAIPGTLDWSDLLASGSSVDDDDFRSAMEAVEPEDVFCILYTSGSSADPKGVILKSLAE